MKKAASLLLVALGLTVLPLSVASAYEIKAPYWRNQINANFRHGDVANGQFVRDGGSLAARSQKPGGGYLYVPVCRTPEGEIGGATPGTWNGVRWTFACLGGNGEVITNGADFTWEYKGQISSRGSISIYSLTYEHAGQTRVICKGVVGGQEVPGWLPLPAAGGIPGKCNIRVMGQTIAATNYYVARHVPQGSDQPSVQNGSGWIDRPDYSRGRQGEPLYRTTTRDGSQTLCRVERQGKWWPGVLVPKSHGPGKPGFACDAFIGTSATQEFFDFQVYVSSKRTSRFGWARLGSQTDFSSAVVLDPGTNASNRRYACQGSTSVGYVEAGTKTCKIPINSMTGVSRFHTHMR